LGSLDAAGCPEGKPVVPHGAYVSRLLSKAF
jgi:hypothetical protein